MATPMKSTRMSLGAVAATLAMIAAVSCVSTGTPPADRGSLGDRNVIVAEEMADLHHLTVADAILELRPHWLRSRGAVSFDGGEPGAASAHAPAPGISRVPVLP